MTMKIFSIVNAPLAPTETVTFQNCNHDISFFLLMNLRKTEEKLDGRYKEGHEREKLK